MVFVTGQSGNPGGRSRAHGEIRRTALGFAHEAVGIVAELMRSGTRDDSVRLQACREILDGAVGRPVSQLDIEMNVSKRLADMSAEELLDFRNRYMALTASPKLIEAAAEPEPETEVAADR